MTLFFLAFLAGVLTVLAPCVFPLLPIILSSGAGARDRITPYVVIGSLSLSILVFTFALKVSTAFITIPPSFWAYFSGTILFIIGLIYTFPGLWEQLPGIRSLSVGANKQLGAGQQKKSLWGDVVVGASLGPVFSSCSPTYFLILAAVLPESWALGTLYLLTYIAGLALVLLLIASLGQKLVSRATWATNPNGWFKRTIGAIFLIVGIAIFTGLDKQFETWVLDSGFNTVQFENSLLERAI